VSADQRFGLEGHQPPRARVILVRGVPRQLDDPAFAQPRRAPRSRRRIDAVTLLTPRGEQRPGERRRAASRRARGRARPASGKPSSRPGAAFLPPTMNEEPTARLRPRRSRVDRLALEAPSRIARREGLVVPVTAKTSERVPSGRAGRRRRPSPGTTVSCPRTVVPHHRVAPLPPSDS